MHYWGRCKTPTSKLYFLLSVKTDNKTSIGEQYLRRCESEFHAHSKLVEAMADSGVKGPQSLIKCDQDGSYNSRQCDQEM